MEFLNPYAFILLFGCLIVFIKNKNLPFKKEILEKITQKVSFSRKKRFFIYLLAYVFLVLALARPIIKHGYTTVKLPKSTIAVIIDASAPMKCKDIYPTRYDAAIEKLKVLFSKLNLQNVSVIISDNNSYLLNPPSNDYNSIIYLLKHINKNYLFTSPVSNINKAIDSAQKTLKNPLIFLTLSYTKPKKGIFYNFAKKTCKGYSVENSGIKFSYSNEDIDKIVSILKNKEKSKTIKILDKTEIFYYFLIIALILIFIATFWRKK